MSKLSKAEAKAHAHACELLKKDVLTYEDKWFILENWQESANHVNSVAGAFFTPPDLASDFALEVTGPNVIDLCAGIGCLSFVTFNKFEWEPEKRPNFTCVEINPDYIAVGKKILPEATWIQADVFELPANIGHFDCAISNPPFGAAKATGSAPRYTGRDFEYRVIDIASDLADYGAFIIPQMSAPFAYSGQQYLKRRDGSDLPKSDKWEKFYEQTKIEMDIGVGVDCSFHRDQWKGVAPAVEIVCADFTEARKARLPAEPAPELPAAAERPAVQTPTIPPQQLQLF
jgi:hypothetical protein